MEEKLAISSSRVGDWEKRKVNRLKSDLAPRKDKESAKSAWAHSLDDSNDVSKLLLRRPEARRALQVLAMFIFKERHDSNTNVRHKMEGVSIDRSAFDAKDVVEDAADHPVKGYRESHRSLKTHDEKKLEAYANRIAESAPFERWLYDISELKELLRSLLARGEIHEEFLPAAQSLLDRWNG